MSDDRFRPSRLELLAGFASDVARRATCSRQQVGAVVATPDFRKILGYGYNGNARGAPNRCDAPDVAGGCGCLHAELNAILSAGSCVGAALITTCAPCFACAKIIVNAQCAIVYFKTPYRSPAGSLLLVGAGIDVIRLT